MLVVPELITFQKHGVEVNHYHELATHPEVLDIIRREIKKLISVSSGFKRYEMITDFRILPERFEVGNELTNLFKVKRHVIAEKYAAEIQEMFKNGSPKR